MDMQGRGLIDSTDDLYTPEEQLDTLSKTYLREALAGINDLVVLHYASDFSNATLDADLMQMGTDRAELLEGSAYLDHFWGNEFTEIQNASLPIMDTVKIALQHQRSNLWLVCSLLSEMNVSGTDSLSVCGLRGFVISALMGLIGKLGQREM